MSILETIATVSTIICVILSSKQNILAWPIGIISVLSLIAIYVQSGIYAQIIVQSISLIQCIIGWYNWGKKDELKISILPKSTFRANTIFFIGMGSIFALTHSGHITYWVAFFDGIAASLALLGNWYLTKKVIQAWPLFMAYNVILVFLFINQEIYMLSLLNIVLFFISLNAYITWKKDLKVV